MQVIDVRREVPHQIRREHAAGAARKRRVARGGVVGLGPFASTGHRPPFAELGPPHSLAAMQPPPLKPCHHRGDVDKAIVVRLHRKRAAGPCGPSVVLEHFPRDSAVRVDPWHHQHVAVLPRFTLDTAVGCCGGDQPRGVRLRGLAPSKRQSGLPLGSGIDHVHPELGVPSSALNRVGKEVRPRGEPFDQHSCDHPTGTPSRLGR
mmetsp:Transcript_222/g.723  ORF Transcript_222/g.723 Transcript_222/m.723 type:complete len:205 (-) Transcript_222:23-637(-)